ncbi:MAG: tetratricopeptide (TPR) repeat protein [Lentimonas sp.]|jgi:tetratricopeptide (TPR) repeat protein
MHSLRTLLILISAIGFATQLAAETKQSDLDTQRLLDISKREQKIYQQIAADPEYYSGDDLERHFNELILSYSTYLSENPDDVSALILYGKLLRRIGKNEEAFKAFLKADELDPQIAVVKQQIGNHLAETGKGKAALTFTLNAIELAPDVPAYHYALGEILFTFRDQFLEEAIFTRDALDREMLKAFQTAVRLEPDSFDGQMRLGEAYYDLASPDWKAALLHWDKVRKATPSDDSLRRQILDLHKARVLGKLGRAEEAKALAATIVQSSLQQSKQQVLDEMSAY